MGTINLHKHKAEKSNKVQKHRHLRMIAKIFRYAEMCVVLILISRLSFQQLPLALKNSSEYFRGFAVSPAFVFLVGNIIIIILIAQSGHFSQHDSAKRRSSEHDLYLEFLKNSNMYQKIQGFDQKKPSVKVESNVKGRRINDGCMVKFSQKESIKSEDDNKMKLEEKQEIKTEMGLEVKGYRRCQSEIELVRGVNSDDAKDQRVLQRCESDNDKSKRKNIEVDKEKKWSLYPEDGMSSDEFRRTVEAFIARQRKLRINEVQTIFIPS
ncbi:hypothetical protein MtrunA17_Chr3g0144851 [Medicago truncatula]|uniref:Transmembrane protein, putative n=1 Tax=Medicago truncatula TaxID=3880 RepID=G7J762_MEDTR|nr:uncharacterized protein LOC11417250 [Medicago truncatula]AES74211.1 transmembrane protein, putative [Medicago truncatula]RHN71309.1 hypothetical protein MtrunA17_Chr3g0144851 [Medicago truncatula]